MVRGVGAAVAPIEEVPETFVDGAAFMNGEAHAGVGHAAAFLNNVLALVSVHAAEQLRKVHHRVLWVLDPVELQAFADQPPLGCQRRFVPAIHEQQVRRRQAELLR